jgi:hypothetical protein
MIAEEVERAMFDVIVQCFQKGRWAMMAEMTATVENGRLKTDAVLPFPDQTRVKLTIEPIASENQALAAWNRLQLLIDQHPIAGLARKFSRDELYERD